MSADVCRDKQYLELPSELDITTLLIPVLGAWTPIPGNLAGIADTLSTKNVQRDLNEIQIHIDVGLHNIPVPQTHYYQMR